MAGNSRRPQIALLFSLGARRPVVDSGAHQTKCCGGTRGQDFPKTGLRPWDVATNLNDGQARGRVCIGPRG